MLKKIVPIFAFMAFHGVNAQVGDGFVVTRVIDGNTVYAGARGDNATPKTIKLRGVEAPRLDQPFGKEAKARLEILVLNKWVVANCEGVYGARVESCSMKVDGDNVAIAMLKDGLAVIHAKYKNMPGLQNDQGYQIALAAEESAKAAGLGMWSQKDPVMPWVWDATHAAKKNEAGQPGGAKGQPAKSKSAPTQDNDENGIIAAVERKAGEMVADKIQDKIQDSLMGHVRKKILGF